MADRTFQETMRILQQVSSQNPYSDIRPEDHLTASEIRTIAQHVIQDCDEIYGGGRGMDFILPTLACADWLLGYYVRRDTQGHPA